MTQTIGIGLIGTGYMGKCHALAWNSVKAVFGNGRRPSLVHLGEVTVELARQRAEEFGFERATGNWRDVVADPGGALPTARRGPAQVRRARTIRAWPTPPGPRMPTRTWAGHPRIVRTRR